MKTKILILDDNKDFANVMGEFLSENFDCKVCTHAHQALLAVTEDPGIRLIISDFAMPDMDGAEFLKQVRAQGNLVPVIFITGEMNMTLALNALRMGAMDLLEKPIAPDILEKTIDRALYIEKRRQAYYASIAEGTKPEPDKILGLLFVNTAESSKRKSG